jgi:arylsulfatase A-like enzyme
MTATSMPSLFTSLYPSVHRVYPGVSVLPEGFTTLAETLRDSGYGTICLSASPRQKAYYNFYQGFDLYEGSDEQEGRKYDSAESIVSRALQVVAGRGAEPFFLYLHLMDVHTPRVLGPPYDAMFCEGDLAAPSSRAELVCRYDRMIRYVDHHVGRLLTGLSAMGRTEGTMVILTADHGELILDHGRSGHGQSLYDELIHVPLIIKLPGRRSRQGVCHEIVSHIDVMPTVLEFLDVPPQAPVQGLSLMALLDRDMKAAPMVFAEEVHREAEGPEGQQLWRYSVAVRDAKWKLVSHSGFDPVSCRLTPPIDVQRYELFDLERDPLETSCQASERPEIVTALGAELTRWRARCDDVLQHYESMGVSITRRKDLDEHTRRRLRAFGYLE